MSLLCFLQSIPNLDFWTSLPHRTQVPVVSWYMVYSTSFFHTKFVDLTTIYYPSCRVFSLLWCRSLEDLRPVIETLILQSIFEQLQFCSILIKTPDLRWTFQQTSSRVGEWFPICYGMISWNPVQNYNSCLLYYLPHNAAFRPPLALLLLHLLFSHDYFISVELSCV